MKSCPQCNTKLNKKTKYCPSCGLFIPHEENEYAANRKSNVLIIALSVLLLIALVVIVILISADRENSGDGANIAEENESTAIISSFSNDPEQITEAAKSVVKLNCYDSEGNLIATGSGFATFEKGVIVTNYHVIEAYPARIEIETEEGKKCNIFGGVGVSKERDIAILYYKYQSANINLPLLRTGVSDELIKGEKVVAIGSPLGLTNTVSTGIFSGYTNLDGAIDIQFTAPISSGSSGGALFNDVGEVIGITYASLESGQNLNFAVPIEYVYSLWESEASDRSELGSFYDTILPHYTIDFVLSNYAELIDECFYLEYKEVSYDAIEKGSIIYCKGEDDRILKGICYADDYFAQRMIELMLESGSTIKCFGIGWLESDNEPYVIIG